ncbi:MAG: YabP/YqfC family sporulation protein [Oscillospiraceae bacterium]|nr:YabP/YqfC family sporulation protein [Oscillospiraceae bacterium]
MAKRLVIPDIIKKNIQALPLPGKPLIEILGTDRVLIEHHNGICAYSLQEVDIKVPYGVIRILGNQLSLSMMDREQAVVSGAIFSVELIRRQGYEDR